MTNAISDMVVFIGAKVTQGQTYLVSIAFCFGMLRTAYAKLNDQV